jgi:glycosyltransferase involved in cell wall biosynthesis
MQKRKILMIGPLPPPAGGVSIHIKRLSHHLKKNFLLEFVDESKSMKEELFNIRSFDLRNYFRLMLNADLIYIHSGSNILRVLHLLTGWLLGKKIILTIHGYLKRKMLLPRLTDQLFYKMASKIIIVNANILERISLPADKCIVRHAFLPPVMEEEPEIPVAVKSWIRDAKQNGRTVICSNAWRLDIFNQQDLYGLDLCIHVAARFAREKLPVAFVFNVSTIDDNDTLFTKYRQQIESLGLENSFLLMNERFSFVRLMEEADIVVRPTNFDGDSLTVREALMLGKPIVASDVVKRPAGTTLFENRNTDDLHKKLSALITTAGALEINVLRTDSRVYTDFYSELTTQLLSNAAEPQVSR